MKKSKKMQVQDISPVDARKRIKSLEKEISSLRVAVDPNQVVPDEVMSKMKKAYQSLVSKRKDKMTISLTLDVSVDTCIDDFYLDGEPYFERDTKIKVSNISGPIKLKKSEMSELASEIDDALCRVAPFGPAETDLIAEANALKEEIKTVADAFDVDTYDILNALMK